ncbi:MAG TPA: YlxR family protein [Dehalococcoidia bacterium]|nr:YlxR family protein [Dehalococcoidia bacterium]
MPKAKLVRIVRTSQGPIIVDTTGRESGRGAYLCHIPECWGRALEKRALDRSFKQDLSDQDLKPIKTYFEANISPQAAAP